MQTKHKPSDPKSKLLTPKQAAFCAEYLIDLNATQAAIRAGYSEKTARSVGAENLTKPDIQAEVQRMMTARASKVEVTAERVLQELKLMAFYDPADIAGEDVRCPADIAELPENVRRAIIGWGWDKAGNFTVKLASKTQQLELLGRHLKMFTDKLEHTIPGGVTVHGPAPISKEAEDELAATLAAVHASLKVPEGLRPLGK